MASNQGPGIRDAAAQPELAQAAQPEVAQAAQPEVAQAAQPELAADPVSFFSDNSSAKFSKFFNSSTCLDSNTIGLCSVVERTPGNLDGMGLNPAKL